MTDPLKEFARWAIQVSFDGYDIDGYEIQEKAEELGLLKAEPFDPEVHGPSDECELGDKWYVMTEALKIET